MRRVHHSLTKLGRMHIAYPMLPGNDGYGQEQKANLKDIRPI